MLKLIKLSIICLLIFNALSVFVLTASAGSLINDKDSTTNLNENTACIKTGDCQLNDFMLVAVNVSNIILALVGSLSLFAFIYGGIMWLLSAGDAEKVMTGKRAIIGAVIGLAIVFTSFMIIQLVFSALGITAAEGGKWAISNWFK